MIKKIKDWRLDKIKKWAQWYADLIIKRLDESKSDMEFTFWIGKGYAHNDNMINKYEIYLD